MNCATAHLDSCETPSVSDRRQHARVDIPAAAIVVGHPGENPQVVTSRILNVSQTGANIVSESPIEGEHLWVAFTADERLILETEIVWSDDSETDDGGNNYGVRFTNSLTEQEFVDVLNELKQQPQEDPELTPTLRQREESLFSLFRGHNPKGAKSK
ncbi:MAG: PilZ domain-containing protein [Planctomycetaceae bacterium]|nr:PilZ domain-containing protein [Planctomycetaceae bacterium]